MVCSNSQELHVHHLVPRYLDGPDTPANLITLCAACHASRHPTLQASLAQGAIRRWAFRLVCLLDRNAELATKPESLDFALALLKKQRFRDGQLEIVMAALRGESLLAVRPTGSGKTLCFQVPALLTPGTVFVISPLKALMTDQITDLHQLRVPATFINSDLSPREKELRFQLLELGAIKFLYVAPERFDPEAIRNVAEDSGGSSGDTQASSS